MMFDIFYYLIVWYAQLDEVSIPILYLTMPWVHVYQEEGSLQIIDHTVHLEEKAQLYSAEVTRVTLQLHNCTTMEPILISTSPVLYATLVLTVLKLNLC